MFWALAQREKDIERGRKEGRQEGRERLIRQLVDQDVPLPPEILKELEDLDRSHQR